MVKVLLHYREDGSWNWRKELREFSLVPRSGEYIWLASSQNWLRVEHVVFAQDSDEAQLIIFAVDAGFSIQVTGEADVISVA